VDSIPQLGVCRQTQLGESACLHLTHFPSQNAGDSCSPVAQHTPPVHSVDDSSAAVVYMLWLQQTSRQRCFVVHSNRNTVAVATHGFLCADRPAWSSQPRTVNALSTVKVPTPFSSCCSSPASPALVLLPAGSRCSIFAHQGCQEHCIACVAQGAPLTVPGQALGGVAHCAVGCSWAQGVGVLQSTTPEQEQESATVAP
jgi:hypothetical protein